MIFKLVLGGVLLSFLAFVLREFGWRGAPIFACISATLLVGFATERLGEVLKLGGDMFSSRENGEIVGVALKALGVSYLFAVSSDVCTSLGEGGVARALDVLGRVELAIIVMPYVLKIIEMGRELLL